MEWKDENIPHSFNWKYSNETMRQLRCAMETKFKQMYKNKGYNEILDLLPSALFLKEVTFELRTEEEKLADTEAAESMPW